MEYLETKASQIQVELGKLVKVATFALLDVAPSYRYEQGKRIDIVDGTKYTVADTKTFEKFDVKTPEKTPVISKEQIESAEERIFISFVNAMAKPVKIEYGKACLSVTADSAKIMRKTN